MFRKISTLLMIMLGCIFMNAVTVQAADKVAVWTGALNGNWSQSGNWNVYDSGNPQPGNPLNLYPNNGNGGFTYDVVINFGNPEIAENTTVEQLTVNGAGLYGAFTLTANGLTKFSGAYKAVGHLIVNGGMEINTDTTLLGMLTVPAGANVLWQGGRIGGDAQIINEGTWTVAFDGAIGGSGVFRNSGVILVNGNNGRFDFQLTNEASGVLTINGNKLTMNGVNNHYGAINGTGELQLNIYNSLYPGVSITGLSQITIAGGYGSFYGDNVTIDFPMKVRSEGGSLYIEDMTFSGGLEIAGDSNIGSSSITGTPGKVTIPAGVNVLWQGGRISGEAEIINNGTWAVLFDGAIGGSGVFRNSGAIVVNGNNGRFDFQLTNEASGVLTINGNKLTMNGGNNHYGTINGTGELSLSSYNYLYPGVSITGLSQIVLFSGYGSFYGDNVTMDFPMKVRSESGSLYIEDMTFSGGLEIAGDSNIGSSSITGTPGKVTIPAGVNVLWQGGRISGEAEIINNGTWAVLFDGAIGGSGVFRNRGTIAVNGNDAIWGFQLTNETSGVMTVNGNRATLTGGNNHYGTINGTGELRLSIYNYLYPGASFTGLSQIVLFSGYGSFYGDNVTMDFPMKVRSESGSLYIEDMTFSGGLEIDGDSNIGSSSITGTPGKVTIPAGTNVLWQSGRISGEAEITSAGAWTITAPGGFMGGPGKIVNYGTISIPTANIRIDKAIENRNTLSFGTGSFTMYSSFHQFSGMTEVLGEFTSAQLLNFHGGSLSGDGVINANVDMAGRITPGQSPGTLTINGNLTFLNGSQLFEEFEGQAGGTIFDSIDVNGNVILAGDLVTSILNNSANLISPSDFYPILESNNPITGSFANILSGGTLFTLDSLGSFDVHYGPSSPFGPNRVVLNNFNNIGGQIPPDLTLISSDIKTTPLNPAAGELFTLAADITNQGQTDSEFVGVDYFVYDPGAQGFIPLANEILDDVNAESTVQSSVQVSFPADSYRLVKVVADMNNTITEAREDNNTATQVIQIGSPDPSTAVIRLSTPGTLTACAKTWSGVSGRADYDFDTLPGTQDFPVQGASMTVQIREENTANVVSSFTGPRTDIQGNYSVGIFIPEEPGTYDVFISITDHTLTADNSMNLAKLTVINDPQTCQPQQCTENCGGGGGPVEPPFPVRDIFVASSGIGFSDSNPLLGEPITILGDVYYNGNVLAPNIPVILNDLYPVAGELQTFRIGHTEVDFNSDADSPQTTSFTWQNTANGAHIIQLVTQPDFNQPVANDKATRLIFVGPSSTNLRFVKSVVLLEDPDENGYVSSGDTLRYRLTYENIGSIDFTGIMIFDDYDEAFVDQPFEISDGGTVSNGQIIWDVADPLLSGEGEKSVTYQVVVKQLETNTVIRNNAILSTAETNSVGTSLDVLAISNNAPVANAGPDQVITVVGTLVTLDGTGSVDPDDDPLTYAWSFVSKPAASITVISNPTSSTPTFIADVQGGYEIQLVVTDDQGASSEPDTVIVSFNNIQPVADAGDDQSVQVDETVHLDGSNSSDANHDELTYSWTGTRPDSSPVVFDDPTLVNPTFVADIAGTYGIELVVNDGLLNSEPDQMIVVAFQETNQLDSLLDALFEALNALDPSNFGPGTYPAKVQKKDNMVSKVSDSLILLEDSVLTEDEIATMITNIGFIENKSDGCADTGAPENNDWIKNCTAQNQVYPLVQMILDALEQLSGQ